jgi:small conductance mechanosensitive channel
MNTAGILTSKDNIMNELDPATWAGWKDELWVHISNPLTWLTYGVIVLKIIIIVVIGWFLNRMATRALNHVMIEKEKSPIKFNPRRARTLGKLIGNVVAYTVNFIVIMMVLNQIGFNLAPLLAGAGVIGLAIGFGAQSLVKDVITGFFIIFEDQFAVGDVVQIGTFKGTVEEIGIRVTRIRSWTGEVHIIPNGSIIQVTNYSVNNSMAVLDISIAYDADIDGAVELIKQTLKQGYELSDKILLEPEVLGVQTMSTTEVVIRVIAECKPNAQFAVSRQMNALIKRAFDERGLKFRTQSPT